MSYHFGRLVLSSLCVGALVQLVLGGVRFAGLPAKRTPPNAMMHGPINIRLTAENFRAVSYFRHICIVTKRTC